MKQLRVALGASIFYIATVAGSLPAQASILEIHIDRPSISAMLPSSDAQEYLFTGSITNTSAYDLNFDSQDLNGSGRVGVSYPGMFQGPAAGQNPLTYTDPLFGSITGGGLLPHALFGSCNWGSGTSSMCLQAGQTVTGAIASVIIGSDTLPGVYAVTGDGAGHPVTISFRGSYLQDGQPVFFAQDSVGLSVTVLSGGAAVPEAQTWALLLVGLAGVAFLSRKPTSS